MEYLQYKNVRKKLCKVFYVVLNLIINGIPSILWNGSKKQLKCFRFKPYYKWNTFNTENGNR